MKNSNDSFFAPKRMVFMAPGVENPDTQPEKPKDPKDVIGQNMPEQLQQEEVLVPPGVVVPSKDLANVPQGAKKNYKDSNGESWTATFIDKPNPQGRIIDWSKDAAV